MESIKRSREEWRDKIKEDLKRIKLKERELENKLRTNSNAQPKPYCDSKEKTRPGTETKKMMPWN